MRYKSLLITGTDTGIGKTTVSCLLAASLRARDVRVGVFKPAETGCNDALTNPAGGAQDIRRLRFFANCELPLDCLCPYGLDEPLAPLVAARRQGIRIDLDHIRDCYQRIATAHDVTLVEGAGGLLVPLAEDTSFADLAKHLDFAVVVVVGNRLGAINHALLTTRHALSLRLHVLGYVINHLQPNSDLAATTNIDVLAELLGKPLGNVPFLSELDLSDGVRTTLAHLGPRVLDLQALLRPAPTS